MKNNKNASLEERRDFIFYEKFLKSVGMRYVEYIVKAITYHEIVAELNYWVSTAGLKHAQGIITSECCCETIRTCTCILNDLNIKR